MFVITSGTPNNLRYIKTYKLIIKLSLNMQQRVTPKSLIAENERRDYGRVRNHLKVILSNQSVGLFQVSQTALEFVLE